MPDVGRWYPSLTAGSRAAKTPLHATGVTWNSLPKHRLDSLPPNHHSTWTTDSPDNSSQCNQTKTNDSRKKMWGGKSWFDSTIKMSVKTNEVWKQNVSHCAQHLAKTPLSLNSVHISQEKSAWLSTTASALKQECLERERSGCSCTLPSERGDGNPKQDKCKGCSPTKQKLVLTEWQAR